MHRPLFLALALAVPLGGAAAADVRPTPAEISAARTITPAELRAHVKFVSSDLTEGRAPGTRGDAIARAYIQSQLEALGLKPAAPEGGYMQKVPLVGVDTHVKAAPRFEGAKGTLTLRPEEFVANVGQPRPSVTLAGVEVVFVGYGIVAPEYAWDDYAGIDVRGKVVLVMNDDPSDDPRLFAGKTRLYYGRWTYKYEEAARHGAAGAIIIHTTPSAAYPWSVVQTSWAGPQYDLPDESTPRLEARLWTTEDASRRLTALGGQDLDALRAAATKRGFKAVPLGVRVSAELAADVSRVETANVLAKLPGSDPRRAGEEVLVTAHHDHLGVKPGAAPGDDAIYTGAVDNATGIAGLLAIARAAAALPRAPARTIVFVAFAAEEAGTLGSEWLARHPPVPAGKLAACVNMDALNIFGRTRDVTMIGLGKSTLDDLLVPLARWQGRVVKGDPFPEKGSFYRSDHFPLAQIGVPAAYVDGGTDYVGRPPGWGKEVNEAWTEKHYHQPSDEYRDDWDFSGMVKDVQLIFLLAAKVADAPQMPRWHAGDEFEAARARALRAAAGGPAAAVGAGR
ncbi:MAG TPA: M20/M25/M40 family metallo-hydrolase, partial [Anaeromyxobacter sp.]